MFVVSMYWNMKRILFTLFVLVAVATALQAEDKVVRKVLELGRTDNRVMQHDDILANVIGGRPVGSHNLEDAEKWAIETFKSMGLEVMIQEVGEAPIGFSRGPWSGKMLAADGMVLHFGTPSYTAGTHGIQRGHVVLEPQTTQELERMKTVLKGAWVLLESRSTGAVLDCSAEADERRAKIIAENDSLAKLNEAIYFYNRTHSDKKELHKLRKDPVLFYRQMVDAGVLGFIQAAPVPITCLSDRANFKSFTWDNLPKVCDIKLDEHQFAIIRQKVVEFQDVILEFDIRNHFFIGPVKYRNIIGVMRGSKYPKEYVMMGGHLDSYDIAGGAVDDGNGASVVIEAARLLAAAGAKPKRTILFCLWTGEEYGLLGSKYFVENNTVPIENISNYFNRDGGPTAASSITVPEAMYDDFVKAAEPVADYTPGIPFTVRKREGAPRPRPKQAGGSDHAPFQMAGGAALSFNCTDPLGYNFNYREIWHTENDVYNKVIPVYMEHSAVVTAVIAYGIANLDHLLSRDGLWAD